MKHDTDSVYYTDRFYIITPITSESNEAKNDNITDANNMTNTFKS